jgi:probable rRNA maturation factor
VVLREALEQGKDPDHHWLHLLLHGTLHLLGYDHENAQDAADMESLETRILATWGIADPYTAIDDV